MGEELRNESPKHDAHASSSPKPSAMVAIVKAYWKLAVGLLVIALLVVFVAQNADAIQVKFMLWEANLSLALVVFLAQLSGVGFGVAFTSWQRWRTSHVER